MNTILFLSVMTLIGFGNILLKLRRNRLPRPVRTSGLALLVAISVVQAALLDNAFLKYFIPTAGIVFIMLYRIELLRVVIYQSESTGCACE